MNIENEFDELAKRKLQEQAFPFEEAHWLDAQRAIETQRRERRGGAWWFVGGAAALVIAAWLLWPNSNTTTVANESNSVSGETSSQEEDQRTPAVVSPTTVTPSAESGAVDGTNASSQEMAEVHRTERATTRHEKRSGTPRAQEPLVAEAPKATAQQPARAPEPRIPEPNTTVHPDASEPTLTEPAVATGTTNTADPSALAGTNTASPTIIEAPEPATPTNAVVATDKADGDAGTPPAVPNAPEVVVSAPPDAFVATVTPDTTASVLLSDTSATLASANTGNPNDSTAAAAPTPVPPPLVASSSPWEVGLLAGLFNTTSTYTGGSSATWNVSPERTFAAGGEVMHLGRNFGYGTGLHYGTYADKLRTPEVYRTSVITSSSWSLMFIDTTILIITGSTSGSQGDSIYLGQPVNTTIGVLRMDIDSTFGQVRVRNAREVINRTSYFEVPLLLDAHLVQGRWSLGLRGGPTVGLLTQRSGSIPNEGEGYTDFNDVAMRSWSLGWTARAYIRYRFNSAWSVGLEPAARGQLVDSFDEQGITRRSNALGCMLSLSYRLK